MTLPNSPGHALISLKFTLKEHKGTIFDLSWSPDGNFLASASNDNSVLIWNLEDGSLRKRLAGHDSWVQSITWSPDGKTIASASKDGSIKLWDVNSGELIRILKGHKEIVYKISWCPVNNILASCSRDKTIRLWNTETGDIIGNLLGHKNYVRNVSWSPDGKTLASSSEDLRIIIWDPFSGKALKILLGHSHNILALAWTKDCKTLVSGSADKTIRLWDIKKNTLFRILEGHTGIITAVSFSNNCELLASKSWDGTVRLWRVDTWEPVYSFDEELLDSFCAGLAFNPQKPILATLNQRGSNEIRVWGIEFESILNKKASKKIVHYVNAKAVLLGESGVGKSGLGIRLAENIFRETKSTHGAQFWQIPIKRNLIMNLPENVKPELTLWDLAGQPEYHLVHQLFLDDTDVALLLFDCSDSNDPFRGVPYWSKVLKKQARSSTQKILISARVDVSPPTVDQNEINRVLSEYQLHKYLKTSAFSGEGLDNLFKELLALIPWEELPRTTTPKLFKIIREILLERKAANDSLISIDYIKEEINKKHKRLKVLPSQIDTVVSLLQARGLVHRLEPTPKLTLVLLKPELINQYASSIIQGARNHERGIGAITERDVVCAELPFIGFKRIEDLQEEKAVLESTVELLIRHDLCFREMGYLVFPSQLNITRPSYSGEHPPTEVTYEFSGSVETIYASLVVRLSYTSYFKREDQWKYAAEFSRDNSRLGFAMVQLSQGTSELEIYFYPTVSDFDRVTFIRFITEHLYSKGIDIKERIRLYCSKCNKEVNNLDAIETRVQSGFLDIPCQYCGTAVIIPRSIEERYRRDLSYEDKQVELALVVEERTVIEVEAFQKDHHQYTKEKDANLHILHLSDIHMGSTNESQKFRTQLESDLLYELKVNRLEYLVISGDLTSHASQSEYEAAFELIDGLVKRFGLDSSRVVIVPGNHDVDWDLSEDAYPFIPKRKLLSPPQDGFFIPAGEAGLLIRDDDIYKKRFLNFNSFLYRKVYGNIEYPMDYIDQTMIIAKPEERILFLGLNSSWEIDHHFSKRSSINIEALSKAISKVQETMTDDGWLKIAVWHHPVTGREAMNDDFMQLLSVNGFSICMHGHIHEAIDSYYSYDKKREIHIIGAGTFGATTKEQTPSIPLQYNLISMNPYSHTVTVQTRKKDKADGAWSADARWEDKNRPAPYYSFNIQTIR